MSQGDLSQFSMLELFSIEVENQCQVLTAGLLVLERQPTQSSHLESCMRAAHSLKGAARILGLEPGVVVAHLMEDYFVAAQGGVIQLARRDIDLLLRGVDLLGRVGKTRESEHSHWITGAGKLEVEQYCAQMTSALAGSSAGESAGDTCVGDESTGEDSIGGESAGGESIGEEKTGRARANPLSDRVLRLSASTLDKLLTQAGEAKVETRWLTGFAGNLLRLKRMQYEMARSLGKLNQLLSGQNLDEAAAVSLSEVQRRAAECQAYLSEHLDELDAYEGRVTETSRRLYAEALSCRMRPFADGIDRFPRMLRDLAASLGKRVRLVVNGESTQVDRDILEKLEAPLGHLLRNAADHGIEEPWQRREAGKPEEGTIHLEARHHAGMLEVSIADDGRGIDLQHLRRTLVKRAMASEEIANHLSDAELLDFLLLPGFSLAESVTSISGRGVGLDAVHEVIRQVRGLIRIQTETGKGSRFRLQLPLSLAVVRSLLMVISGDAYALPLAYVGRTLKLASADVRMLQGRPHFLVDDQAVGLVSLAQVLDLDASSLQSEEMSVLVVGDSPHCYGLVVDQFLGERELVVQPLNPRLGKLRNISAGAVLEDGAPVLIIDLDDLLRSVDKLIADGEHLSSLQRDLVASVASRCKRVLVVDDSLTVRELERKLLESRGFHVEIAVDGMDGWNAFRTGQFDLVITDVDMPRMDGIELVRMIRSDSRFKSVVVMIVSYKEREEDRRRGLEAGADYYLTKGSFHEDTLLQVVEDLIGEARI